jgi:hypothetical protein
MNYAIESIVAASLAAAKAASDNLSSREEYLAEYDSFLALLIARRRALACDDFTVTAWGDPSRWLLSTAPMRRDAK